MAYAGKHRVLTYLSWVLSVISALVALVPFWYIWCIIRDVLAVAPHFAQAENIAHYGWAAVLFAVISIVVYIGALMCSHLSAFRVASNIGHMHYFNLFPSSYAFCGNGERLVMAGVPQPYPSTMPMSVRFR